MFSKTRPILLLLSMVAGLTATLLLFGCSSASPASSESTDVSDESSAPQQEAYTLQQPIPASFNITSTSLKSTGFLQSEFTCEGTNSSPHIAWDDVPAETQSIAIVAEDLDLAGEVASHWLVWGLPPDTRELPVGVSGSAELPAGAVEGVNSRGQAGYKGPCPPPKVLNSSGCRNQGFESSPYAWTVYALSGVVPLGTSATRDNLLRAIDGTILGAGSLDVKYISKQLLFKDLRQYCN